MSIPALDWAFALSVRQPVKGVLLALANRANKEGRAWPSRTLIAIEAGVDLRTVISATKRLEDLGLIEVEHSSGNRVNRYSLRVGEQCHAATVDGDRGSPSNRASTVIVDHRDGGAGDGDRGSPHGDRGSPHGDRGASTVIVDHRDGDRGSPEPKRTLKATHKNPQEPGGPGGVRSTRKPRSRRTLPAAPPKGTPGLPAAPPKGTPGLGKDGLREIKGLHWPAFAEWDCERRRRGGKSSKSWTPAAQEKCAELLAQHTPAEQQAIVDASIAAGWQGLFSESKGNVAKESQSKAGSARAWHDGRWGVWKGSVFIPEWKT